MKFYSYDKCSTCKKAEKFLLENGIDFKKIDITTKPPSKAELTKMLSLQDGDLKKLFNTNGKIYRDLNLKEKVGTISKEEAFQLLTSNGMLVKRPFILGDNVGLVGFKVDQWQSLN